MFSSVINFKDDCVAGKVGPKCRRNSERNSEAAELPK